MSFFTPLFLSHLTLRKRSVPFFIVLFLSHLTYSNTSASFFTLVILSHLILYNRFGSLFLYLLLLAAGLHHSHLYSSCLVFHSGPRHLLLYSSFPHVTLRNISGHIAQLVTCLATDKCLTPNPGAVSLSSMVIFLPSTESFQKGCCQLQARVCARVLVDFAHKKCC